MMLDVVNPVLEKKVKDVFVWMTSFENLFSTK